MFESEISTPRAVDHTWLWLLLPFMTGIYVCNLAEITEATQSFLPIVSMVWLGLWLFYYARFLPAKILHFILLPSFFFLGAWALYFNQNNFQVQKKISFQEPQLGQLTINGVQIKKQGLLLQGSFVYMEFIQEQKNKISKGNKEGNEKNQIEKKYNDRLGIKKKGGGYSNEIQKKVERLEMQIYTPSKKEMKMGETWWIAVQPKAIQNEKYPGAFDLEKYFQGKGITHQAYMKEPIQICKNSSQKSFALKIWLEQQRQGLSTQFRKYLSGEAADIAIALIVGDRQGVSTKSRFAFQGTGSMHIMAVSGMHIALLLGALLKFFSLFGAWISRQKALLILLLILWYYAWLTGLSPAVLRSVVMFSFLIVGQLAGRQISSLNLLYFSAFLLLVFDPFLLFDLGFQLSYMAMWGIFMFYPSINALFTFRWGYLQTLWEGTAMGFAATLSTAPLSLYYFHSFPNYFALANLFLMSLSSFILMLGMFFPILAAFPFLNQLAGWILQKSIEGMLVIMDFFAHLPGALVNGFQISFLWVLLLWLGLFIYFQTSLLFFKRSALLLITCFIIEFSLGRMEQYALVKTLAYQKEQLFIFKNKGKAILFSKKDVKATNYMATQLTTYYGVNTSVVDLN